MPNRRKPISFDTTLRNPERIPQFISVLSLFENQIITSDVALELEAEIIRRRIFEPKKETLGTYKKEYHGKFHFVASDQSDGAENKVKKYYDEWVNSDPAVVSREKIVYLLKNTMTDHKEPGWDGGWESRIGTQFNFLTELGFVRVVKNKKILISDTGKLMIKSYKDGEPLEENFDIANEQSAFLNAFAKYQINNPYRKNTINVNFFPLVLNVIKHLDETYEKSGISIQDLPFIIVWGNNNYRALAEYIYKFRNEHGYNTSNDIVYEYAMNLLDEGTENVPAPASRDFIESKGNDYKIEKIMKETPDEVIRKLRYTMLISLRGGGRFIDINHNEISKINYILNNYSQNHTFENEDSYFEYMGEIDSNLLLDSGTQENEAQKNIKERLIENWAYEKDWIYIKNELTNLSEGKKTKDDTLKFIKETARLEFLIAIALKKALPHDKVIANYIADDQGFPFNTATGENSRSVGADIDVYEEKTHTIVEPTLAKSYSFQVEHELPSIGKHLIESANKDVQEEVYNEWFALFVAPIVNKYVGTNIVRMDFISGVKIFAWTIEDFVDFSQKIDSIKDYKKIRPYAKVVVMPNI